jgi:hypothetical protein
MYLEEVIESPATLQEALQETVKWLDIGDAAIEILAQARGEPIESGREIQEDLLAVVDFLDNSDDGKKLGRYIWRHRYDFYYTNDEYDDDDDA